MWSQLEPTPPHITYLVLSLFLITYALFSVLIRNRLHLAEPPLAALTGIILGPSVLDVFSPHNRWGLTDTFTLELTRLVLCLQCFAVGVELPPRWLAVRRHAVSLAWLLGPVMLASWLVTAALAHWVLGGLGIATAMVIAACLSPTDPILSSAVLGGGFSERVPARLRALLAAESACNDGASFPLLHIGLAALSPRPAAEAARDWLLVTVLYQCALGLAIGLVLGRAAQRLLRASERRGWASEPALVVFYLLLALLCAGIGSTLGSDDFLVAFGAGVGFAHDGWFGARAEEADGPAAPFRSIADLMLTSGVFVYFGAAVPFHEFAPSAPILRDYISPGRLTLFFVLVLVFRRIPALLALRAIRVCPDIKTWTEALFAGHFGPMGVGALFLAVEARANIKEEGEGHESKERAEAIAVVWPVVCFVVLGSTIVHGLSVLVISLWGQFTKRSNTGESAPLLGEQSQGLAGMVHDDSEEEDGDA